MAAIKSVGGSQTGEKILAAFPVPYKGVQRGHSEVEIGKDALWIGENFHFFQGELRQRPSWNLARNTTIAAPPTGFPITGIFSAHRANTRDQFLIVGGSVNVHVLTDAASGLGAAGWNAIVTWGATRAQYRQVRYTEIATSTPLVTTVVICNGVDTPRTFTIPVSSADFATSAAMTAHASIAVPIWRDVCTAADRIVGVTDTEVSWTANLSVTGPASTNFKALTETPDLCIAIRPLSTLNVGVWKERSFWIGVFAGGTDATAFRWRLLKQVEGPGSPAALTTDSHGNWFWMTKTGRVVKMEAEGYQITFPGDGVWPITRDQMSLNITEYGTMHAVYRPFFDEVWFFYSAVTA
jgi:hypothetical protein